MKDVVRPDELYRRRCRLGFAAIALAMPVVLAAWALTDHASEAVKLLPMLAWLAYSATIAYVVFVRPLSSYRCPRCGRPLPRFDGASPAIRFRCALCGVEWDVGRTSEGNGGE